MLHHSRKYPLPNKIDRQKSYLYYGQILHLERKRVMASKGFTVVRVTSKTRTVREIRHDAASCASCGRVRKTLYDYVDDLEGQPAFCNKSCWMDYEFSAFTRQATSIEEAPESMPAFQSTKAAERPGPPPSNLTLVP